MQKEMVRVLDSPPLTTPAVLVPEYEDLGTRVEVHLTCDESKSWRR